jgi:hypothetical protein
MTSNRNDRVRAINVQLGTTDKQKNDRKANLILISEGIGFSSLSAFFRALADLSPEDRELLVGLLKRFFPK